MVQINFKSAKIVDNDVFISLASIGLLFCMVVTLMGIKFRWFKHRMTFENTPSSKAIGINRAVVHDPSIQKHSKHFLEPVIVHGVFRKRLEEDLEYERPKSLPPVRIRKSSNVPSMLPNVKRNEVHSQILETFEPPPAPPLPISSPSSLNNSPKLSTNKNKINASEISLSTENITEFPVPKARTYGSSLANDNGVFSEEIEKLANESNGILVEIEKSEYDYSLPYDISSISEEIEKNYNSKNTTLERSKSSNFDFICDVGNRDESERRPSGFVHFADVSNLLENEKSSHSLHKVTFEMGNDSDDYNHMDKLQVESHEETINIINISNETLHSKLHRTSKHYNDQIFELEEKNVNSEFPFKNNKSCDSTSDDDNNWTTEVHSDLGEGLGLDSVVESKKSLEPLPIEKIVENLSTDLDKPRTLRDMRNIKQVQI